MKIDERLFKLRKEKGLSQEEVADILNVSRQTISKWETGQSSPDFDKIIPLCELYKISCDELLIGKDEVMDKKNVSDKIRVKGISIGIFLYFISLAISFFFIANGYNPFFVLSIFIFGCGMATFILVYTCMMYKKKKENKVLKKMDSTLFLIILTSISLVIDLLEITSEFGGSFYDNEILHSIICSDWFGGLMWIDNLLIYFLGIWYIIKTIKSKKEVLLKVSLGVFSILTTMMSITIGVNLVAEICCLFI